jgi:DNA-binding NtrC family response regulator
MSAPLLASVAAPARTSEASAPVIYVHTSPRERPAVRERLGRLGVPVTMAGDIADAIRALGERRFALCLVDLADERAALTAIRMLRAVHPALPLAGIADPANPAAAAEAMYAGALELVPWPIEERELVAILSNVRDRGPVDPRALAPNASTGGIFAQSAAMRHVLEAVRANAPSRRGMFICGESGTGRTLVARAVHALGGGTPEGFVLVDCAGPGGIEEVLFGASGDRSEGDRLTGVEQLAPTAAVYRANGGTLMLTNLVEASARIQLRLARLLRDGEATVGEADRPVALDVRVVAAVEPDVDAAVHDGGLRRDLVERLSQTRIDVPPLRSRREDIPSLAVHFARQSGARLGGAPKALSRAALALLSALPWHGNARELATLMDGLVRSVARPVIQLDDVLEHARLDGQSARMDPGVSLRDARARFERECITAVLIRHHGRVGEAAKALGIQRTNLYRKVRQLNVARSLLSARK